MIERGVESVNRDEKEIEMEIYDRDFNVFLLFVYQLQLDELDIWESKQEEYFRHHNGLLGIKLDPCLFFWLNQNHAAKIRINYVQRS